MRFVTFILESWVLSLWVVKSNNWYRTRWDGRSSKGCKTNFQVYMSFRTFGPLASIALRWGRAGYASISVSTLSLTSLWVHPWIFGVKSNKTAEINGLPTGHCWDNMAFRLPRPQPDFAELAVPTYITFRAATAASRFISLPTVMILSALSALFSARLSRLGGWVPVVN